MMTQSPIASWPEHLNDQVAMLRLEPADLTSRSGVLFEASYDNLDDFMGAVCHSEGLTFALMRYKNNPVPGTVIVFCEAVFDPKNGIDQLTPVLRTLGVAPEDVIWFKGSSR
jgi:hypothetical protein